MSDLESEILEIIAAKAPVDRDKVTPEAKMTELELESLDVVEIIFAIEEKYDIEVPYNANSAENEFESVGDVIRSVQGLVKAKA